MIKKFIDKVFSGNPRLLINHLLEEDQLSKEDIEYLKLLLTKREISCFIFFGKFISEHCDAFYLYLLKSSPYRVIQTHNAGIGQLAYSVWCFR